MKKMKLKNYVKKFKGFDKFSESMDNKKRLRFLKEIIDEKGKIKIGKMVFVKIIGNMLIDEKGLCWFLDRNGELNLSVKSIEDMLKFGFISKMKERAKGKENGAKKGDLFLYWLKKNKGKGFVIDYKKEMRKRNMEGKLTEKERKLLLISDEGWFEWDFGDRMRRILNRLEKQKKIKIEKKKEKLFCRLI